MEESYADSMDPEKLIPCPYDKNHQIRACRFPYHLIKCRKNHPEMERQLATCPFNARHQVPREEINIHISSCDDKRCIEEDIGELWLACTCKCFFPKAVERFPSLCSQQSLRYLSCSIVEYRSKTLGGLRAPKALPCMLPWKSSK
uniref:Gametocyte specific factor 1 n=1 Tax=Sphenodon punctatus TaxID=8508 RepID=A0A8D0H1G1_SPHPU